MIRFLLPFFFFHNLCKADVCSTSPCVNGKCSQSRVDESNFVCNCHEGWAGIRCNLPRPEVICGNKTIEIFIDDRIVTEQGLSSDAKFVHFFNSPECSAEAEGGGYYLKVDAPFKKCGMLSRHEGNDFMFYQQIVWNEIGTSVERPLILLDFKCTYQDKYIVSNGEVIPKETSVKFETSYGVFKVNMNMYRNQNFEENQRFGPRPVVSVEDKVCVSTELHNVIPRDLVLTNRECWASTVQDGSGDTYYLISEKCQEDPTTDIVANGEGDAARVCFQMFRWKEAMEELFVHCVVNVCNATAGQNFCQCENSRQKRFSRSVPSYENGTVITFGPVYLRPADWTEYEISKELPYGKDGLHELSDEKYESMKGSSLLLIIVGIIIAVSLVALGVAVAVYVNCRRKSRDSKSSMRVDGQPVVIPNPTMNDAAMLH